MAENSREAGNTDQLSCGSINRLPGTSNDVKQKYQKSQLKLGVNL